MNLCIKAHLTRTHTYIQVKVRHAKLYRHACQQLSAGTPSRPGLVRKWYQAGKSDGTKQARSTSTKQVGQLVPSRLDLLEPSRPGLRVPSRPDLLVPSRPDLPVTSRPEYHEYLAEDVYLLVPSRQSR